MTMTRRQFAQSLGAAAILLPFMRNSGFAAGTGAVRRVVVMTSLGISDKFWSLTSAPGSPVTLSPSFVGLAPVLDELVFANNLGFVNDPSENHSTPQTLTGKTFGTASAAGTDSIDQFIAGKLGSVTKLASLNVGVIAKNEGQFWRNGNRLTPIDSPADAFQSAFGAAAMPKATPSATAGTLPRQGILNMVSGQVTKLRGGLGTQAQRRLDAHLASISQLEKSMSQSSGASGVTSASCSAPAAPTLSGQNPEDGAASAAVAQAHAGVIAQSLACDVTRVVGMQFGISNNQFLQYTSTAGNEEHSQNHSPGSGDPIVLGCENFLCQWYASLVTTLKNTPDPLNAGTTMLDNTLILWARDIGDGPNHVNYALPYVLSGATGYLKKSVGGTYVDFGGNNGAGKVGTSHQRLLLNLAEFMGITDYTGFGDFAKVGSATPLAEIKA